MTLPQRYRRMLQTLRLKNRDVAEITGLSYETVRTATSKPDTPGKQQFPRWLILAIHLFEKRSPMNWIDAEIERPPVDESSELSERTKTSIEVLTYSDDFGMRFGRYAHAADFWRVEGMYGNIGAPVTHWMIIEKPNGKKS